MFICEKPQNGTSVKFGCKYDGDEVLVSSKARWRITKIDRDPNGIDRVFVEPISNKNKISV